MAEGGWFILRFDAGARYILRVGAVNAARTDTCVQQGKGGPAHLAPYARAGMLVRLVDGPAAPNATGAVTAAPTVSAMP